MNDLEYAGFWVRAGAALIDTILIIIITLPIIIAIYGDDYLWWDDDYVDEDYISGTWDFILSYLFPAVAVIVFWFYKSATPGKMANNLMIVDAQTGGKPTVGQFILRYLGYYLAMLPLCLGIIWVGIDKRKQGWHDKLAGTVVVRSKLIEPVTFENKE